MVQNPQRQTTPRGLQPPHRWLEASNGGQLPRGGLKPPTADSYPVGAKASNGKQLPHRWLKASNGRQLPHRWPTVSNAGQLLHGWYVVSNYREVSNQSIGGMKSSTAGNYPVDGLTAGNYPMGGLKQTAVDNYPNRRPTASNGR